MGTRIDVGACAAFLLIAWHVGDARAGSPPHSASKPLQPVSIAVEYPRDIDVRATGASLRTAPGAKRVEAPTVACCVPDDDGGAQCEERTPERCAFEGGTIATFECGTGKPRGCAANGCTGL